MMDLELKLSDMPEIVHERDGKWWFWNETYIVEHGPYDSAMEAHAACSEYADTIY